jgi:hypothetical protein
MTGGTIILKDRFNDELPVGIRRAACCCSDGDERRRENDAKMTRCHLGSPPYVPSTTLRRICGATVTFGTSKLQLCACRNIYLELVQVEFDDDTAVAGSPLACGRVCRRRWPGRLEPCSAAAPARPRSRAMSVAEQLAAGATSSLSSRLRHPLAARRWRENRPPPSPRDQLLRIAACQTSLRSCLVA